MLERLALTSQKRAMLEEATQTYVEQLSDEAREYLAGRGLTEETVASNLLGVAGDPLPGHEKYRGRLVIPYITPAGVVTIRFRTLDGTEPKYLSMSGAGTRLYNVAALHTGAPFIAICEGEFDALALTQAGLPAVAYPGASTWEPHFTRCFADFETVYVIGDNDVKRDEEGALLPNPGQRAAEQLCVKLGPRAINVTPPPNVDVNEWLLRDGREVVLTNIGVSLDTLEHSVFTYH